MKTYWTAHADQIPEPERTVSEIQHANSVFIIIIIIMHFISGSKAHKNAASKKTETN